MSSESQSSAPHSCPKCKCQIIEEWTVGRLWDLIIDGVKHDHDPNRQHCLGCGHMWFKDCPVCGTWREA